jgi:ABC-type antimicrobial peptide transport system permease subunit
LSFLVLRRKREIGIRMALGARRGQVIRLLLSEMALVMCSGVLAGLAAAILCGQFVQSELYGVKSFDAAVFLASVVFLAACSLLAAALPAWRASRVDVTTTLRQQ